MACHTTKQKWVEKGDRPAGKVKIWPGQDGFRACIFQCSSGTSIHHIGSGFPDWNKFKSTVQQKFSSDSITQEGGSQRDQTQELRDSMGFFTPSPFSEF